MDITTRVKLVRENNLIKEILSAEPDFAHLLEMAAHPIERYNRWESYVALKNACSELVGWSAQRPELRTSYHHEAMCWAFDMLLPDETETKSTYEQIWDALMNGASPNLVHTLAALLPGEQQQAEEKGA